MSHQYPLARVVGLFLASGIVSACGSAVDGAGENTGTLSSPLTAATSPVSLDFASLPSAQGWTYVTSGPLESDSFNVGGAVLHQTTMGSGHFFQYYTLPGAVDSTKPFTLEVTAEVTQSETEPGWGPSFGFGVFMDSEIFEITIDTSTIKDANNVVVGATHPGPHNYRLEGTPSPNAAYKLFVDDAFVGDGVPSAVALPNQLWIGDGSSGANAQADVTYYRFSQGVELKLPWAIGETWYVTNGAHSGAGGTVRYALDFAPPRPSGVGSCDRTYFESKWVRASADGVIQNHGHAGHGVEVDHSDGTRTGYYHLTGQPAVGTFVRSGDPIGHPACVGGSFSGAHVHFYRCRTPVGTSDVCSYGDANRIPADGAVLSGWVVSAFPNGLTVFDNGTDFRVAPIAACRVRRPPAWCRSLRSDLFH